MNRLNAMVRWIIGLTIAVIAWVGVGLSPVLAQDNPIPLNWRSLTVQVIETYGNNFTKPLLGAKVKLELKDPSQAAALQQTYPTLQLPAERTSQTTGARFGKLPPSSEVGPYIVTVIPKPNDNNNEYICEEKTGKDTREFRMGGGSDQRLTFNFECKKADTVNEFNRRAAGGYDLTVKVEQNTGTRGYGLWVHLYDKNGNRIKKVRTGGSAEAKFRAVNPAPEYNPYKVEVYSGRRLLYEDTYEMPAQNATYTADLNSGSGNTSQSYNLTVKFNLWVHLYDNKGKLVKKVPLSRNGTAAFRNVDPKYNPYKIEVYSSKKLLYSETYEVPSRNSTYSID